jgi:hypothetical protein
MVVLPVIEQTGGGVGENEIETESLPVQPTLFVTTTVYVPLVAVIHCVVSPVFHT